MKPFLYLLLTVCVLTACSVTPTPNGSSGVYGRVTIGPMCPVVRAEEPCPDKPYQTTLVILNTSGEKVTNIATDAAGRFRVNLSPGDYILQPETPQNQPLPISQEQQFSVVAGRFTELNISYDSGIR
jgi:hypothetical protein